MHVPCALHSSGVALCSHVACEALCTSPVLRVDPGLGSAGLLALPPSLPAAPTPAVQNPHREGSDLSSVVRSQRECTLTNEKKHLLYSPTFLQVFVFFVLTAKYFLIVRDRREGEGEIL